MACFSARSRAKRRLTSTNVNLLILRSFDIVFLRVVLLLVGAKIAREMLAFLISFVALLANNYYIFAMANDRVLVYGKQTPQ